MADVASRGAGLFAKCGAGCTKIAHVKHEASFAQALPVVSSTTVLGSLGVDAAQGLKPLQPRVEGGPLRVRVEIHQCLNEGLAVRLHAFDRAGHAGEPRGLASEGCGGAVLGK